MFCCYFLTTFQLRNFQTSWVKIQGWVGSCSRFKISSFVTNLWLTKFDGLGCSLDKMSSHAAFEVRGKFGAKNPKWPLADMRKNKVTKKIQGKVLLD